MTPEEYKQTRFWSVVNFVLVLAAIYVGWWCLRGMTGCIVRQQERRATHYNAYYNCGNCNATSNYRLNGYFLKGIKIEEQPCPNCGITGETADGK